MARYPNLQPIYLTNTVKDRTGAVVDAGAHLITVQKPDGTTQTYTTPTHDGTGLYHQDIPAADLTVNGHYMWTWQTTGTGAGLLPGNFDVYDPFEVSVLPLQDAKDALNIPRTSTTSDSEIQMMIYTIESSLEMLTGGPIVTRSVTERVTVSNGYSSLVLRKRPVVAVTSITDVASGAAVPVTDLDVDTNSGIVNRKLGLPFIGSTQIYTVVYTAGWGTAVPPAFNVAARIILSHLWETQMGPTQNPYGQDDATLMPGMSFAIPNRALELLSPYVVQAYV